MTKEEYLDFMRGVVQDVVWPEGGEE